MGKGRKPVYRPASAAASVVGTLVAPQIAASPRRLVQHHTEKGTNSQCVYTCCRTYCPFNCGAQHLECGMANGDQEHVATHFRQIRFLRMRGVLTGNGRQLLKMRKCPLPISHGTNRCVAAVPCRHRSWCITGGKAPVVAAGCHGCHPARYAPVATQEYGRHA